MVDLSDAHKTIRKDLKRYNHLFHNHVMLVLNAFSTNARGEITKLCSGPIHTQVDDNIHTLVGFAINKRLND